MYRKKKKNGHQERELVGLQRAVTLMAQRELTRRAERGQIEPPGHDARMLARAGQRGRPAVGERVEAEALEDFEGHALGDALGEPLIGTPVAARQRELRDVGQFVGDQPPPLARSAHRLRRMQQDPARPGRAPRRRRRSPRRGRGRRRPRRSGRAETPARVS